MTSSSNSVGDGAIACPWPSVRPSARDYRRANRVGRLPRAGGSSGASFSSRTRKPFHNRGISDSDVHCRQCAAKRNGAYNPDEGATSRISRAHLIPVLPLIEPTGEKGFMLIAQQSLQRRQENFRWLRLGQKRVHSAQFVLGQRSVRR